MRIVVDIDEDHLRELSKDYNPINSEPAVSFIITADDIDLEVKPVYSDYVQTLSKELYKTRGSEMNLPSRLCINKISIKVIEPY
jgi:hypothetical protein